MQVGDSVRDGGQPAKSLVLRPRSLLLFWGDSYTNYLHGITEDCGSGQGVGSWVANGAAADAAVGEVIDRDVRTSLTIRRVNNASSKPVQ